MWYFYVLNSKYISRTSVHVLEWECVQGSVCRMQLKLLRNTRNLFMHRNTVYCRVGQRFIMVVPCPCSPSIRYLYPFSPVQSPGGLLEPTPALWVKGSGPPWTGRQSIAGPISVIVGHGSWCSPVGHRCPTWPHVLPPYSCRLLESCQNFL